MMQTKILKIKGDWQEVVDDCRATVSKPPLGKEPSVKFKEDILIAEHSPIRNISARFLWEGIPYAIAMHWKTHTWQSKVNTQRADRTGVDRSERRQTDPVNFIGEMNAQNMIDTMRKRLCYMADPETRVLAEDFKAALRETEPEISETLVPNCVYRCGCPEIGGCGFWARFLEAAEEEKYLFGFNIFDIKERYSCYNYRFYRERQEEKE